MSDLGCQFLFGPHDLAAVWGGAGSLPVGEPVDEEQAAAVLVGGAGMAQVREPLATPWWWSAGR